MGKVGCIAVQCISGQCIALKCIALELSGKGGIDCIAMYHSLVEKHCITLHCIGIEWERWVALWYIGLHYMITLQCIKLKIVIEWERWAPPPDSPSLPAGVTIGP